MKINEERHLFPDETRGEEQPRGGVESRGRRAGVPVHQGEDTDGEAQEDVAEAEASAAAEAVGHGLRTHLVTLSANRVQGLVPSPLFPSTPSTFQRRIGPATHGSAPTNRAPR
jgi:hypothetical protein